MREVPAAFEGSGVLKAVDVDRGAGVVFDLGPFRELDAGDRAVCEEGRVVWVLLDSVLG